ncbi:asparaginase [Canibacter zhoujuaniae]|uniref:asparaginase n=1 Tax=Canibacter zhoujuaniae TaxID=2708343 RepID=UPI001423C6E0|nr:asparaginase [Canibacter zhoujuaniae]
MPKNAGTFAVSAADELAVTTRGGFIESRHAGSAIVLSPAGDVVVTLGDPNATILTRSALKPLQSLAMHEAGLSLPDARQTALSFASHSGTPTHTSAVREILADAGLGESHLLCPPDWPADTAAKHRMIAHGNQPSPINHCCSGKHAAMLRTCLAAGWPVIQYTHPEHPLQQHIIATVQRMTAENPSPIAVDGCGAPVLGLSLAGLARGYRRMATADPKSPFPINRTMRALLQAGMQYPEMVEGPNGMDTIAMQHAPVFAKFGAEGVSVMAAADGTVAAVKILDGNSRASRAVALSLLTYAGAVTRLQLAAALAAMPLAITGGGQKVGDIRVSIPKLSAR